MEQKKLVENLLKNTHVNFLLGAGTSYKQEPGKINFPLMGDLREEVAGNTNVINFYDALSTDTTIPSDFAVVVKRIYDEQLLSEKGNIEKFLSALEGIDLYIANANFLHRICNQREEIKKIIRDRLKSSNVSTVMSIYDEFYNGLKRIKELTAIKNQTINIFTTNYDMMNEIAMERQHIHYYSGFEGVVHRKFNLTYYNYDFVENFALNQLNVKVVPNHINLFKVHGSLSWCMESNGDLVEKNPLDIDFIPEIIYPSVDKFDNTTLITSYSSLMREMSSRLCMDKTTLFVSGMSMGDEHINKIIENALSINTFHLVIFCADSHLITELKEKYKPLHNVIVYDDVCYFSGLADILNSLQ